MNSEVSERLFVFIMAGGSGERFWPMSRASKPKHLLKLLSERTLLEETVLRVLDLVPPERLFILTNEAQLDLCREAVKQLPENHFIAEPARRDTAPACALATAIARTARHDALCALLPADAMVHDGESFRKNLSDAAVAAAEFGAIATIGIVPSYPATAYGYLKLGDQISLGPERSKLRKVEQFVEKPDGETAERYCGSGNFAWNAGLFVWEVRTFLSECKEQMPALADFINDFPAPLDACFLSERFPQLPKISVDYAIMERAKQVVAVEATFDWDDVGSWSALPTHLGKDANGNTICGSVVTLDSHNSIGISNGRLLALCGVSDLIVVETADAILVCHRDRAQRIKQLHELLPKTIC